MQNLVFTAKQRIQTGRDRNYEEKRKNECDAFIRPQQNTLSELLL